MKHTRKLSILLFALFAMVLTSCNLSKNVNSTASSSYKKMTIAQQSNVQKHEGSVATSTATTTQPAAEQVAVNTTPAPVAETPVNHSVKHKITNTVKKAVTAINAPGKKLAERTKKLSREIAARRAQSTVNNAEITIGKAIGVTVIGLVLAIIFIILAAAAGVSGNLGAAALLYVLAYLFWVVFLVGLVLIVIALVNNL